MKANTKNIVKYINEKMGDSDNIAIYLPRLNKNTFNALANYFKVQRQPFGYVRFERLANKDIGK